MQETQVRSLGREDPRRRKWQPTLVLLPGESHGQRRGGEEAGMSKRFLFFITEWRELLSTEIDRKDQILGENKSHFGHLRLKYS